MNKKTGEFSAADLKRQVGRKAKREVIGLSPGREPGKFVCCECKLTKPESEIKRDRGPGNQRCAACCTEVARLLDPTYRTAGGNTRESYLRNKIKTDTKRYRAGKLPKWMFS